MAWNYRNIVLGFVALCVLVTYKLYNWRRSRAKEDRLRGPQSRSVLYGFQTDFVASDPESIAHRYEKWFEEYGGVFCLPWTLGTRKIVIGDPKALQHICSRDAFGYGTTPMLKAILQHTVGGGILAVDGEMHKRQRKALSSGFSNTSIRALSTVFFDAGHKTVSAWRNLIDAEQGQAVIDVQEWMNRITLDSIGLAGFSHDFSAISGKKNFVADAFEKLAHHHFFTSFIFVFARFIPALFNVSTDELNDAKQFKDVMMSVANGLLEKSRKEKQQEKAEMGELVRDKSIIGLLIEAEQDESGSISTQEVLAQNYTQIQRSTKYAPQNTILVAGFVTTSVSLTWALIELSRHPERQHKLREELLRSEIEAHYDELMSSTHYPYLDAVVHEILRLHPAVSEITRQCKEDDVVPLSHPVAVSSGGTPVNSIRIQKGTLVSIPICALNSSEVFWGANAKEFVPERWLDTKSDGSYNEIHGYRHILTFMDGPRTCLGKTFAVAEFKVVLAIMIRNFAFELPGPGGIHTKITTVNAVTSRPKVDGQTGLQVPLLVRAVEDT